MIDKVEIGDKILFSRNGTPDELELWEVVSGGYTSTYPGKNKIGIDLLFAIQDGTGKTLLQSGIEAGYIRLIQKAEAPGNTSQEHLANYIQRMQNLLTMDCMKYWRSAGENRLTKEEATKILATLEAIQNNLKYAGNCCHWIINGWEKDEQGNPKKPDNATSN